VSLILYELWSTSPFTLQRIDCCEFWMLSNLDQCRPVIHVIIVYLHRFSFVRLTLRAEPQRPVNLPIAITMEPMP
jgi:hypothetical protein